MRLFIAGVLYTYAPSLTARGYFAGVSFPIGLASFFQKSDYGLFPFLGPPAARLFKAIAVFSLAWKTRYVGGAIRSHNFTGVLCRKKHVFT
jgi:hypothetical protein